MADGEESALDIIRQSLAEGLQRQNLNINDLLATSYSNDQALAAQWVACNILPEDNIYRPLQYHSPANQFPTAALGLVDFRAVKWQNQPVQNNVQMGATDMGIFTFDDNPLHIVSIYNPNPGYLRCMYDWTFNGVGGIDSPLYWAPGGNIIANKARTVINATVNMDFHGLYLYTQRDQDQNNYFWLDAVPGTLDGPAGAVANSTITLRFPGITGALASTVVYGEIGLYRWYSGNPKLCDKKLITGITPIVGGQAQLVFTLDNDDPPDPSIPSFPTYSDYYTVRLAQPPPSSVANTATPAQIEAAVLGGVYIRQESRCSVLQHFAAKEIESFIYFFSEKGRINALGLRVTDVPMLQYQNGLISGFVCLNGNSWYQYYQHGLQGADSFFNKVATSVGAKVHAIERVRGAVSLKDGRESYYDILTRTISREATCGTRPRTTRTTFGKSGSSGMRPRASPLIALSTSRPRAL